jgi:hypothetical protein
MLRATCVLHCDQRALIISAGRQGDLFAKQRLSKPELSRGGRPWR